MTDNSNTSPGPTYGNQILVQTFLLLSSGDYEISYDLLSVKVPHYGTGGVLINLVSCQLVFSFNSKQS